MISAVITILIIRDWLTRSNDTLFVDLFFLSKLNSTSVFCRVLFVEIINIGFAVKDGKVIAEISVLGDSE